MRIQETVVTLNDLFAALFRPGEGEEPVIREPRRPLREALFAMFFPDALVGQYADKSKSNLTWFFTSDARNKSVRRSLIALLERDARGAVSDAHRKCRQALWPAPGRAVFDGVALRAVLAGVKLPDALNGRLRITRPAEGGGPGCLERFYDADEAAALSRMILTLAVAGDAPQEVTAALWRDDTAGDCAFMRSDDSVPGAIRYARMLDLQGRYARAFEGYDQVALRLNRAAQTLDESVMFCRMGEMLFTGEGCDRDEQMAQACDRMGCMDENPKSWYQLSRHISGNAAREALERAAALGYGPAIRQLGMAWYTGSARLATTRSVESARRWFRQGLTVPGEDGAYCAYMLGQIHEALNERDAAVNAYRVARENGSAEAEARLARLDWLLAPAARTDAEAAKPGAPGAEKGYCLVNGLDGCNRRFLDGLEGDWSAATWQPTPGVASPEGVRVIEGAPQAALRAVTDGVYWGGAPRFPELVIALMSDDRPRNLRDAVALLGELRRMAQALGERAWDLVDQVRMYVLADHDDAELLLDAAFAGMGRLYFKTRVCDPALDAADRLLTAAPLFLPRLRAAEDAPVRLKVIGCGDVATAVLRRAIALPMPEAARLTVDVYGEGAAAMERRFHQRCPGARDGGEAMLAATPRFHECAPEEALLSAMDADGGLGDGNYYVVAAGDDALNLRLGALLRGELLQRDLDADRQPFIAAHTAHPTARWLGGDLPAGPATEGAPAWCARYELYPFGALDMYAPRALANDALERYARQAHTLFIGLPNTRDARHDAMGGYYRRQFNRDIARMAALSLPYRMHLAGVSLISWRLYGMPEEAARLGAAYSRWLRDDEHLKAAVRDEHVRRCRMLLSLGWRAATPEDVARYVRRGNPGHILYPAKLDPFICPWAQIEDGSLYDRVRDIVRGSFPEKSVPNPRRDEEASVRDTEGILEGGV